MRKKVISSIEKTHVGEDGTINYSEETRVSSLPKEPNFVKLYLDDILYLNDLPKGLNAILYVFLKQMNYGNQLVLNAALKRKMAKELDLSVSSINNAITKFVKGKLLIREDQGLYLVNPQLFGKGEWKDIAKIRLKTTYDFKGRTISAEIEKAEQAAKLMAEIESEIESLSVGERNFENVEEHEPEFPYS